MDPISALNVATAAAQFIEFSANLVSTTREILSSAEGATADNLALETVYSCQKHCTLESCGFNCFIVFLVDSLAEPESLYACTLYSAELAQPLQLRSAISAPYSSVQLRSAPLSRIPPHSGRWCSGQSPEPPPF